jgi:hypothetical protein
MAKLHPERGEVNARIVYWGIEGAGKSTSIRLVAEKLRADHRGRLRRVPTPLDPTAAYDLLPIELGAVAGMQTRIQVIGVPGAPEQAPTRKQLLDQVDGIVFVIDAQRRRLEENLASFEELRGALAAYGRSLDDVPLVFQCTRRDPADPFALEELHRKLGVPGAAVFEAASGEGTAVLQALTTVSKAVIRRLRDAETPPAAPAAADLPAPGPPGALAPARLELEATAAAGLSLESVGTASHVGPLRLRLPLVLTDSRGGRLELALTLSLDALLADEDGSAP